MDESRLTTGLAGIAPSETDSETPPEGLVEISGVVKWFDIGRGYGFVIPDDGGPDALLHVTVLRRDGFTSINEGARVVGEAVRRERGVQIFRVKSVTAGDPAPSAAKLMSRPRPNVNDVGGFEIVIVKWFNRDRGFGFLTRGEGTEDIFVHMETLRRFGILEAKPGDSLLARFGHGEKGLTAAEVRPLDGTRRAAH